MSNPYLSEKRLKNDEKYHFRIGKESFDVYLYSIRTGFLEKRFGNLSKSARGHAQFVFFNQDFLCNDRIIVSQLESRVFNGLLWLREENDNEAKRLFIQHENAKCEELKEKMEKHRQNLILLQTAKEWHKA